MIKKITIEVIPHTEQRYNTVGDWQFVREEIEGKKVAKELNIKVSDINYGDEANMLVAVHELVEALLCESKGVDEVRVDEFDKNWKPRDIHWSSDKQLSEPGEDDFAPYYREHQVATGIERMLGAFLWLNWARYELLVDRLCEEHKEYFERKLGKQDLPIPEPLVQPVQTLFKDDDIPF
jgi:hypothetical protein